MVEGISMKCSKTQRLLNMYIDKELPADKVTALQGHLAGCQRCTQRLNELVQLKELVQTAPKYTANPFLWTRISAALTKKPAIPTWVVAPKVLKLWTAVACMLILISSIVLTQVTKVEVSMYQERPSIQNEILEIPAKPENMERIALNLLVYTTRGMEVNYALY